MSEFEMLYQNRDGKFLCDSLQPFHVNGGKVRVHNSTRYINVKTEQTEKELPELYSAKELCCGCSACLQVCPKSSFAGGIEVKYKFLSNLERAEVFQYTGAISMLPDEEGFLYPVVDAEECIRCYSCLKVCPYKET